MHRTMCILASIVFLCIASTSCVVSASRNGNIDFPKVVERIKSTIGCVEVQSDIPGVNRTGTTFLIDSTGIMVTCRHVVIDTFITSIVVVDSVFGDTVQRDTIGITDSSRIIVRLPGTDAVFRARIVAERKDRDVVLLQLEKSYVSSSRRDSLITPGTVNDISEGEEVGCTGFDLGQTQTRPGLVDFVLTTHRGIISAKIHGGPADQPFTDMFQLDMLVNGGASGGPVYRAADGVVLGIVQSVKIRHIGDEAVGLGIANCQPIWVALKMFYETFGRNASCTSRTVGSGK